MQTQCSLTVVQWGGWCSEWVPSAYLGGAEASQEVSREGRATDGRKEREDWKLRLASVEILVISTSFQRILVTILFYLSRRYKSMTDVLWKLVEITKNSTVAGDITRGASGGGAQTGHYGWLWWLPTETEVECGTSQSKSGTFINLGKSGLLPPVSKQYWS